MKSWTALNINEFILFDMFGSPCRRVAMFSKFAGSLLDPLSVCRCFTNHDLSAALGATGGAPCTLSVSCRVVCSSRYEHYEGSTNKRVNYRSRAITQTQQQRPESPKVKITWHVSKYKVHKLHQRYRLWSLFCFRPLHGMLTGLGEDSDHSPTVVVVVSWCFTPSQPVRLYQGEFYSGRGCHFMGTSKPMMFNSKRKSSRKWPTTTSSSQYLHFT